LRVRSWPFRGSCAEGNMRKITLADRLRYRFDNTISRGTVALIGWLFVLLGALVFASSLIVYVTGVAPEAGGRRLDFLETLWLSLMRTIDPGGVGGDQGTWPFLLSMLAVTAGGILVFSTLIGVIFTGIDSKLDELRKGRSFVVEKGHTVVYGWSPEVFSLVSELVAANESRPSACIAVLAEKDKVEMEDEIRDRVGETKNTRVVCRTGDPIDIDDLELVNPHEARSIIVLPPEGGDADSRVIKTILALTTRAATESPTTSFRGCASPRTWAWPGWSGAPRSSWCRWTTLSPASPPKRVVSPVSRPSTPIS
jgi:hypothetical protein